MRIDGMEELKALLTDTLANKTFQLAAFIGLLALRSIADGCNVTSTAKTCGAPNS